VTSSITHWILQIQAGNRDAAQPIWERYYSELVGIARRQLYSAPRTAADEEDVLVSVFDSFFRGAALGRFPDLADRNNLWRILVVITIRKAIDRARHERRQKRLAVDHDFGDTERVVLDDLIGNSPTPELCAITTETCRELLQRLTDDKLRTIAIWKMEGYTGNEIAAKMGCSSRTIERKLGRIRRQWADWAPT
jgi:DNA-directed RNA polymerase specialized sigma24 family protein